VPPAITRGTYTAIFIRATVPDPATDWPAITTGAPRLYYCHSRFVLGSDPVSREDLATIARAVRTGLMVGLPVYASTNGGLALRAGRLNQYGTPTEPDPIGWVAATRSWVDRHYTAGHQHAARELMRRLVARYTIWVKGDIWDVTVLDRERRVVLSREAVATAHHATLVAAALLRQAAQEAAARARARVTADPFAGLTVITEARPHVRQYPWRIDWDRPGHWETLRDYADDKQARARAAAHARQLCAKYPGLGVRLVRCTGATVPDALAA
jgi:hypothetical protein